MLTQIEADALIQMPKRLAGKGPLELPNPGDSCHLDAESEDGRESFIFDVARGRIRLSKCTFQNRYRVVERLVRVDIDGPPHENPDGEVVPCPHIHVYREGYEDKWAKPLPADRFIDSTDLVTVLRDFLLFCKVTAVPEIHRGLQ